MNMRFTIKPKIKNTITRIKQREVTKMDVKKIF